MATALTQQPSSLLRPNELSAYRDRVERNMKARSQRSPGVKVTVTVCHTAAQLYMADQDSSQWRLVCAGVPVVIDAFKHVPESTSVRSIRFLAVVDYSTSAMLWRQQVAVPLPANAYRATRPDFHTFRCRHSMTGLLFAHPGAAESFRKVVIGKAEDEVRVSKNDNPFTSLGGADSLANAAARSRTSSLGTAVASPGPLRKRRLLTKADISGPANFVHIKHIGLGDVNVPEARSSTPQPQKQQHFEEDPATAYRSHTLHKRKSPTPPTRRPPPPPPPPNARGPSVSPTEHKTEIVHPVQTSNACAEQTEHARAAPKVEVEHVTQPETNDAPVQHVPHPITEEQLNREATEPVTNVEEDHHHHQGGVTVTPQSSLQNEIINFRKERLKSHTRHTDAVQAPTHARTDLMSEIANFDKRTLHKSDEEDHGRRSRAWSPASLSENDHDMASVMQDAFAKMMEKFELNHKLEEESLALDNDPFFDEPYDDIF